MYDVTTCITCSTTGGGFSQLRAADGKAPTCSGLNDWSHMTVDLVIFAAILFTVATIVKLLMR
jgi:hypothetical protein